MPAWHPQTQAIRGGRLTSEFGETSEALFLTSGFSYQRAEHAEARFAGDDPGFMYSRVGNPTVRMFERRLALLEGMEACAATATGMAAVFAALMSQIKAGDRVVAARALFGSCDYIVRELLPRYGVEVVTVDGRDLRAWQEALSWPTTVVFFETPSNPTLELIDIGAVCDLAHKAGASVVIDNVFATPILQRPGAWGADIVVYSATKHIDGQGRCLGGAILSSQRFHDDVLHPFLKHTGPAMSPFNAWVLLKGLETLPLRVKQHVEGAETIAGYLDGNNAIHSVLYPGLAGHPQHDLAQKQMAAGGALIAVNLGGDKARAFRVLNRFELISLSNNLGDVKTLATHPATTTHSRLSEDDRAELGIGDDLIRLSIGLEHPDDLIADLRQALAA